MRKSNPETGLAALRAEVPPELIEFLQDERNRQYRREPIHGKPSLGKVLWQLLQPQIEARRPAASAELLHEVTQSADAVPRQLPARRKLPKTA